MCECENALHVPLNDAYFVSSLAVHLFVAFILIPLQTPSPIPTPHPASLFAPFFTIFIIFANSSPTGTAGANYISFLISKIS